MKIVLVITGLLIIFVLGFLSLGEKHIPASFFTSPEVQSPGDWIQDKHVNVYDDKVVIAIDKPIWASFANTNSMDPLLDEKSNAIEIKPKSADQVQVGDIISYHTEYGTVIHRIIKKGID